MGARRAAGAFTMTRTLTALCALLVALGGGCMFSPRLGEGQVACASDGTCPPSYFCHDADRRCYTTPQTPGQDGGVVCVPAKCPTGACGQLGDGCGNVLDCGNDCPSSAPVCGGGGPNVCGVNACKPIAACGIGQNCSTIPDGCASTVPCGTCGTGQACAGDGTPNRCCTPKTTCPAGLDCGTYPDGCGGAISCGTCTGQKVCGGGGIPNHCGAKGTSCTTKTCADLKKSCGTISNGCDGVIPSCGICATGHTCIDNVCN
jgi:hypothetical protein